MAVVVALVLIVGRPSFWAGQSGQTPQPIGAGEVYLHGGDDRGDNPFDPDAPPNSAATPIGSDPFAAGKSTSARSFQGQEPSIYGGVPNQPIGGRDDTITHFESDRTAAEAAVQALNSDKDFRWRDRGSLTVDALGAYLADLTPVVLRMDLRVTYHLLREGRAVPEQAVLQAGTVVLVDVLGVPRIRSLSGSPLTPPQLVQGQLSFRGTAWAGFDASKIFEIRPSDTVMITLTLFDFTTKGKFERPCGTTGDRDTVEPTTTPPPAPPTSGTTAPTGAPTTTPRSTEVDVSGVWILASEFSGVAGTLVREGSGYRFHTPQTDDHAGWDCYLGGQPGQTATMECIAAGSSGVVWKASGPITTIPWNGKTKLRFDGQSSAGPTTSMTLTPQ